MADGHLGYGVPIGGVIASENRISPTAVGFDIACGNKAVRLDIAAVQRSGRTSTASWTTSASTLSFGVGRKNHENNSDSPFITDAHEGWKTEAAKPLKHKANAQLGTIGSGNHYVDIFVDEQDRVWGRRALRLTWSRPRDCDMVPQGGGCSGRHDGRPGLLRRR